MDSCAILANANRYVPAIPRPKPYKIAANPRFALPFRRKRENSRRRSRSRGEILKPKARGFVTDDRSRDEIEKIEKKEWIHFVGIGGSGISALAMLALKQGFEVSGSDIMWSSFMDELQKAGARINVGHSTSNLESNSGSSLPNALVISSAIPVENEEVAYAKSMGIPMLSFFTCKSNLSMLMFRYKRDGWLRRITEHYNLIAISGTHGKSTTAAMLSFVLSAMGDDLIAVVGANVPQFKEGNIIPGSGPNFVLEADEYDCCFLGLSPSIAVVTNVEWDHVDIFQNEEAVLNIFKRFLQKVKVGGHLVLCGDSAGAMSLVSKSLHEGVSDCEMVPTSLVSNLGYSITTYGISTKNDWHASSVTANPHGGQDYVLYHKECPIANISLVLPGDHNVLNSLAVIATVASLVSDRKQLNAAISSVAYHLRKFEGVSRRFELIGSVNKCHIYDDYAHHPTEVRAVLQAARQRFPTQAIWIVFQPHTFSRLAALMKDFTTAFTDADHVIITQIYSAREKKECSDGRELASLMRGPSSEYIPRMEDVVDKLVFEILSDKNQEIVVLTLGAGDITTLGPKLLERLRQKL